MMATKGTSLAAFHPVSAPDYVPAPLLRELQLSRLKSVVTRAWERVPLYRTRMERHRLTPDDVRSLDDIARLPFTVKADLREPSGLSRARPFRGCPARLVKRPPTTILPSG